MSINFDRAAEYYDATRGYGPETAAAIAQGLAAAVQARPATRFLEIGVGTGRIAVPLAELGYAVTGVDISQAMLAQLRAKLEARAQAGRPLSLLAEVADMHALPYADSMYDAVIATHVFHLVPDPEGAAWEAFRVLRPAGSLLICGDQATTSQGLSVTDEWRAILYRHGLVAPSSTEGADKLVRVLLDRDHGLALEETRPASWQSQTTPAEELDSVQRRLWSNTWRLTEDEYDHCLAELLQWYGEHCKGRERAPLRRSSEFVVRRLYRRGAAGQ